MDNTSEWVSSCNITRSAEDIPYDLLLVSKVIMMVVMTIGIPGNLLTLIVIVHYYGNLRVSGVAFIANLALSDLLYLSFILPIRLVTVFYGTWPLGETELAVRLCEVTGSLTSLLKLTSMLSLAAIALNR